MCVYIYIYILYVYTHQDDYLKQNVNDLFLCSPVYNARVHLVDSLLKKLQIDACFM